MLPTLSVHAYIYLVLFFLFENETTPYNKVGITVKHKTLDKLVEQLHQLNLL